MNTQETLDINNMILSGRILATAMYVAKKNLRVGLSLRAVDSLIEEVIVEMGGVPVFKGYEGFPCASCISVNEDVVHGIPSDYKLKEEDMITIDIGVSFEGHCTDSARTFFIEEGKPVLTHPLIQTAWLALNGGIKQAVESNRVGDISHAIHSIIQKANPKYSVPLEFGGHGIGLVPHADPFIPNYGRKGSGYTLPEGICLAIEPIVFDGSNEIETKEDGWTVCSTSGVLSSHVEDTIVVTRGKPLVLTRQTIEGKNI